MSKSGRFWILVVSLLAAGAVPAAAQAATVHVDVANTSGTEDGSAANPYSTIQAAVDAAQDGDTVQIAAGTYVESVYVRKPLTLRGDPTDPGSVTVTAAGNKTIIDARADDVHISGLRTYGGYHGIQLVSCLRARISYCVIEFAGWHGIVMTTVDYRPVEDCVIKDNLIRNNNVNGMSLSGSGHLIQGNEIRDNSTGIYPGWGLGNTEITGNEISGNTYALLFARDFGGRLKIRHNNFIGNGTWAAGGGRWSPYISWEDGYRGGGNYWSDWTGPDTNNDGIVDQPRGRDFFPVTAPGGWTAIRPAANVHNRTTGISYPTITEAVAEAAPGDRIEAQPGEITAEGFYYENVRIEVPLVLAAAYEPETDETATIRASRLGSVLTIAADDVTVSDLTVTGAASGAVGIAIEAGTAGARVTGCTIRHNGWGGILIAGGYGAPHADEVTVEGNTIHQSGHGVSVGGGPGHRILDNRISGCATGVTLLAPALITGNTFVDNSGAVSLARYLAPSPKTEIYHNNFYRADSTKTYIGMYGAGTLVLDLGYPGGGNFYHDHTEPDLHRGPNQDQPGADGIVDVPLAHSHAVDRYPFAEPDGWLNSPPTAHAGPDLTVLVGEAAVLDASASADAEGPIARYEWDFGDGSAYAEDAAAAPDGAFDGVTSHAFTTGGVFNVALTVTDTDGATGADQATVTVRTLAEGLQDMRAAIVGLSLPSMLEGPILTQLDLAHANLAAGSDSLALLGLNALLNHVTGPGTHTHLLAAGWNDLITVQLRKIRDLLAAPTPPPPPGPVPPPPAPAPSSAPATAPVLASPTPVVAGEETESGGGTSSGGESSSGGGESDGEADGGKAGVLSVSGPSEGLTGVGEKAGVTEGGEKPQGSDGEGPHGGIEGDL